MKGGFDNSIILLIYITIIVILASIIIPITIKYSTIENFDNSNFTGLNIQTGISSITPTGTINFTVPYQKTPMVFTQIIGTSNTSNNSYSVQIFNVTNKGFDYSKNKVINATSGKFIATKMGEATVEPFQWIAFG